MRLDRVFFKTIRCPSTKLQTAIQTSEWRIPEEKLDQALQALTTQWLSGTSTTIYDILSGSGDLGLISSAELRRELFDQRLQWERLVRFEDLHNRFLDQHLKPYLNDHAYRSLRSGDFDEIQNLIFG